MKYKNIEFKRRKIFERVEEGAWSDAIIKYLERPWLHEEKGVFITETIRHALRIDLFFVQIWKEWETKKRRPNPRIKTLMPMEHFIGIDLGMPGMDHAVMYERGAIKNGYIEKLEDIQIYKPGEPLFTAKGPIEVSEKSIPRILEHCRNLMENWRLNNIAERIWPIHRHNPVRKVEVKGDEFSGKEFKIDIKTDNS